MTHLHERREPIFEAGGPPLPLSDLGFRLGGETEKLPSGAPPDAAGAAPKRPAGLGHGTWPWLGLAAAALVLATPVLGSARLPAAALGPAAAAPSPESGITGEEIVPGSFSLRLAGASSADDLWRRWADLRQRRLGLFDDVPAAVRPVAGGGAGFLLLVGDYRNAADAAQACGTLRAHALDCEVMRADGSALKPQA